MNTSGTRASSACSARSSASRPTTRELYAVTNNHNIGKAPTNAAMIEAMLRKERVAVPPTLFARYRKELEPFALPDPPAKRDLFETTEQSA